MAASSSIIKTEPVVVASTWWRLNTATSDIDGLSNQGEFKIKRSALARIALYPYLSSVLLNDSVSYGKSKPRASRLAFSRRGLGGEERIVNLADMFRSNARPGVAHDNADSIVDGRSDTQSSAGPGHGVFGIHKEVQKYLLQLARVAVNQRQVHVQIGFQLDLRGLELMFQKRDGLGNDLVHVDVAEFGAAGAGEIQQVIHDRGS